MLEDHRQAFNRSKIGQTIDVLFERRGRYDGQLIGRSPWLQSVWVEAHEDLLGQIARVHITGQGPNSLNGVVVP